MKRNGFTLVELLAVIVILAVILAIAIPSISGIVNNAKRNAMEDSAKILIKAMMNQKAADDTFVYTDVDKTYAHDVLHIDTSNYQSVTVEVVENKPSVTIVGSSKWSGLTAAGTYNDITVTGGGEPEDTTPPVITITGDSSVTIASGSTYSDAGATALDDVDGDITANIETTSTVNVNVAGTYTVTYTVSDTAGNEATATRTVIVAVNYSGPGYIASKGVNGPVITTGMTPIKWNGTAWVDTTISDVNWYNYTSTDKQWANAKTADGSMWVWIPRYIYRISTGWHTASAGTIDIQFSMGTDDTRGGTVTLNSATGASASNNTWTKHLAFIFGTDEITGVWVAKFEATAVEGVANGGNDGSCPLNTDNVTTKTVKVIPNATAWRCIDVGKMFTVSRSMETNNTYGWGTSGTDIDTHLMKNVEWGAAVYLSKSTYGQGTNEIWINPTTNYTTGCAGNSLTSASTASCLNSYETTNGVRASTTGNVYGIYDMVGGSEEIVAAYINNGHSALNYGSSIISADAKYKEVYAIGATDTQANNYPLAVNKKGDAVYETSSSGSDGSYAWFGDYTRMPSMNCPWFMRGGRFRYGSIGTLAGAFSFTDAYGSLTLQNGFRPTLLIKTGL